MCKITLFGGTLTTISGAKVQQKMHIRKYLSKKNYNFLYNMLLLTQMIECIHNQINNNTLIMCPALLAVCGF